MPEFFPDILSFAACFLIMAAGMLIYATVGFGAGMFCVSLMAMVLPELSGPVAVLLIPTFLTEAWVLLHDWRRARIALLIGLVPAMFIGIWFGTQILVGGNVGILKRLLGLVVTGAGLWFFWDHRRNQGPDNETPETNSASNKPKHPIWLSIPVGLCSGILGGLFGTGGPPVIILLKAYRLDKGAFRVTILWFFMLMSLFRGITYAYSGVLTRNVLIATCWLLPASIAGMAIGMIIHRRISEKTFSAAVSILLIILGVLLIVGINAKQNTAHQRQAQYPTQRPFIT